MRQIKVAILILGQHPAEGEVGGICMSMMHIVKGDTKKQSHCFISIMEYQEKIFQKLKIKQANTENCEFQLWVFWNIDFFYVSSYTHYTPYQNYSLLK